MKRFLIAVFSIAALAVGASSAHADGPATGLFVIGDQNATVGNTVTFWGAQWWKLNSLSGGPAPASFKGWASHSNGCNPWTTEPGNSSDPPPLVAPFIEVIVSSSITKSGPTISGNSVEHAIVQTNPGYAPNPGHAGTGTVVDVLRCGRG